MKLLLDNQDAPLVVSIAGANDLTFAPVDDSTNDNPYGAHTEQELFSKRFIWAPTSSPFSVTTRRS